MFNNSDFIVSFININIFLNYNKLKYTRLLIKNAN